MTILLAAWNLDTNCNAFELHKAQPHRFFCLPLVPLLILHLHKTAGKGVYFEKIIIVHNCIGLCRMQVTFELELSCVRWKYNL
jgi:hypothetical protein